MQVHVDRGGERYGPYSLEDVNAYLTNGTLLPTDQAWQAETWDGRHGKIKNTFLQTLFGPLAGPC